MLALEMVIEENALPKALATNARCVGWASIGPIKGLVSISSTSMPTLRPLFRQVVFQKCAGLLVKAQAEDSPYYQGTEVPPFLAASRGNGMALWFNVFLICHLSVLDAPVLISI